MVDSKLITAWPAALGTLYIGIAKAPTKPYSVARIINGLPNGRLKSKAVTMGRYVYQVDVYTTSADKNAIITAANTLYQTTTFALLQLKYVSAYSEKSNLHRHILELTIRDKV